MCLGQEPGPKKEKQTDGFLPHRASQLPVERGHGQGRKLLTSDCLITGCDPVEFVEAEC